jgi:hypothetical protein
MMTRTENGPYFNENARLCRQACAIDAAGAKGRLSAPFHVGCLQPLFCQFNFMPGPNSTGRRKRHLHPSFSPEIQFPPLLRAPGPIPVSRPQAPVASWRAPVCPSLTLQHACADLNTVGHSKPYVLDQGNVSIISSHFPLLSASR